MQTLAQDEREKRVVDIQRYFRKQVISSCPVRLMVFLGAKQRSEKFRAELLSPAQAVSVMMQEYISNERAKDGGADYMFDIFTDMTTQAPSYRLWLSPNTQENAGQLRALLEQHSHIRP
jgi:hypothetical protein